MLLALAAVVALAALGRWQLSRAAQKQSQQQAIVAQTEAAPLSQGQLLQNPGLWQALHRPVKLQGQWLHQHTVFLENRVYQGRIGFWVFTPLQIAPQTIVLVQRGWVARDITDSQAVPMLVLHTEPVHIAGRIAMAPSPWLNLPALQRADSDIATQIRQNIDLPALQQQWQISIQAVILQTDPSDAELIRDQTLTALNPTNNLGYAFQWFAMSATLLLFSIWHFIIRPLRHAKPNTTL